MSATVLVIDDEPPIRKLLRMGLSTQGYAILEAPDGRTALDLLAREGADLAILDLGLPDMRGHDLLKAIRAAYPALPVVVLSSRDDETGKVEALDLGADDYVTKPFGMAELLARLRAALRHQLATQGEQPIFRVEGLTVDLVRRIVRVGEDEVKLTPREYDFLRVLVLHAGKVLTHAQLMQAVSTSSDPQYLRVYMRQLRQKLEADPERPRLLRRSGGKLDFFVGNDHGVSPPPGLARRVMAGSLPVFEQAATASVDLHGDPSPLGILADDEAVLLRADGPGGDIAE